MYHEHWGKALFLADTHLPQSGSSIEDRHRQADCIEAIAANQSREAFSEIFEFFAPRVKSYLLRLGTEDSLAEELAQEVLVTVWRKSAQYDRKQASVSTWIFRIARNRRIDAHRRSNKPDLEAHEPSLKPPEIQTPEILTGRGQQQEIVRAALDELPPEQFELLHAAFYEGLSHSEIAKAFDLPLGTVKSRIRLAFNRLRSALEGER